MAIHRYWRLIGFATTGNAALELSEARIYEGGSLADASATLTATIAPSSGAVTDLRDGVATGVVSWLHASYSVPAFALTWDFGAGLGVEIPWLRLGSGISAETYPADFTAQYSDDGQNWTTYSSVINAAWPGALTLTTATAETDPHAASVVLYLPCNGANGSTTFTDISPSPKTITAVGNAQISTAQSVVGGSSAIFDGTGDYLSTPASVDTNFRAGAFAVEAMVYLSSSAFFPIFNKLSASNGIVYEHTLGAYQDSFYLYYGVRGSTIAQLKLYWQSSQALNTWAHVVIQRDASGYWTAYKDGVPAKTYQLAPLAATSAWGAVTALPYQNSVDLQGDAITPTFGGSFLGSANGHMALLRIYKGAAPFSGQFIARVPYTGIYPLSTAQNRNRQSAPAPERMLPAIALPDTTAQGHTRESSFFDAQFGGTGTITGTVKQKALPDNTPLHRRVLLMDQRSQVVFRETWSDAVTGAYTFLGVKTSTPHTVLTYDYAGTYRAVIADNILATP